MRVRRFKVKDATGCSEVILGCIDKNMDIPEKNKEFLRNKSQPAELIKKSKKVAAYVCESDGKILGAGVLDKSQVRAMFVKPNMQKKGVGSKILNFIIQRAKSKGLKKVWLKSALQAVKFYEKNGFKKIKKIEEHGIKMIKMEKEI